MDRAAPPTQEQCQRLSANAFTPKRQNDALRRSPFPQEMIMNTSFYHPLHDSTTHPSKLGIRWEREGEELVVERWLWYLWRERIWAERMRVLLLRDLD